jgi:hypothetical protein
MPKHYIEAEAHSDGEVDRRRASKSLVDPETAPFS